MDRLLKKFFQRPLPVSYVIYFFYKVVARIYRVNLLRDCDLQLGKKVNDALGRASVNTPVVDIYYKVFPQ